MLLSGPYMRHCNGGQNGILSEQIGNIKARRYAKAVLSPWLKSPFSAKRDISSRTILVWCVRDNESRSVEEIGASTWRDVGRTTG